MIELLDTIPDVDVLPAEFKRLLGYPRDHVLEGRARELAEAARAWYAKNGRPWVYARHAALTLPSPPGRGLGEGGGVIAIDGIPFASKRLQATLEQAEAHGVILVAVSAGPELEREARSLWDQEKPDEYFFLEVFGSAVVEHLTTMTGARLCAWADRNGMAVLPHYSPGYPEWDIGEQPRLLKLLQGSRAQGLPGGLEVFDTGMLRPKKSLLAVFGLTKHTDRVRRLTDLVPCESCSFATCQYRRAPYLRAGEGTLPEAAPPVSVPAPAETLPVVARLDHGAKYATNKKALGRWAEERLTLTVHPDGTIDALFNYEGTTCTNMGRPLAYHYRAKLGPREQGYPLREQSCAPAPGDVGHTYQCRYMNNAEHLTVAIEQEKPLLGQPLNDILSWRRPEVAPACYCEPQSRKHKWGLVLETIHFALVEREKKATNRLALPPVKS